MLDRPGGTRAGGRGFTSRSSPPRRKARDDYLAAQTDEIEKRPARAVLALSQGRLSSSASTRPQPEARRAGRRRQAEHRSRLRGVIDALEDGTSTRTASVTTRSLAPWHAFAALPEGEFAAGPRTLHASYCRPQQTEAADPPARRPAFARQPAGEHGRGGRPLRQLVRPARGRRGSRREVAAAVDPGRAGWESLRQALHGPSGPLRISPDDDASSSSIRRNAGRLDAAQRRDRPARMRRTRARRPGRW